jgi:hypothetical protein
VNRHRRLPIRLNEVHQLHRRLYANLNQRHQQLLDNQQQDQDFLKWLKP